ncbi:MAG: cytochrome c maturation protein CcmE [Saezia sp.]
MTDNTKNQTKKRLLLTIFLLVGIGITAALVLFFLRSNIDFFYTPRDVVHGKNGTIPHIGQRMQIGGMVMPGSVKKETDSLAISFVIFDKDAQLTVHYKGILPDLFEEGQSVVVKGILRENHLVEADNILAKHDENYTPPEVEAAMRDNHIPGSSNHPTQAQGDKL